MSGRYLNEIVSTPILTGFTKEQIHHFLLSGNMKVVTHKKNAVIHLDGEVCNILEIIIGGKVVIDRIDSDGNLLTITEFGEGDILGGNIMFSSTPVYLMTVTAVEDCVFLEIPKKALFDMLSSNKLFLKAYLEFVSDLTTVLGNKIRTTIHIPLRKKIIHYLKQEYKTQQSSDIKLQLTKKALAEQLGVQRTSLSRELKKMEREGLLWVDNRHIKILKQDILE